MWYGILDASLLCAIWSALAFTHITIIGVTVFLHRSQAHRSVELHSIVNHFFRFWMWLTTGMITKKWVAVHRKHHAKAESQEDPHSPVIYGINKVLWDGISLYRKAVKIDADIKKYGSGTPKDWLEDNVYTPLHRFGIFLMLFINLLLFGVLGLLVWLIQIIWIPFFAAGVINGVAHYFGYRNFEVSDNSRNIFPLGILIGGEELHNNHHAYGASAKFSVKWYEFDYGWFIIKTLQFFRLAKVKRVIPSLENDESAKKVVEHLLYNKIQLIEKYCKKVIKPVFKADDTKNSFPRAAKLMVKEFSSISIADTDRLNKLLDTHSNLKVVYDFRKKLEEICKAKKCSFDEVSESLQSWCRNAKETGIKDLQQFATWLENFLLVEAK